MADLSAVLCDHVQEAGGGGGVGWGLQPADGQVFQAAGQLSGRCAGQVDPHPAALKKRKFVRKSGNLPEKKKKNCLKKQGKNLTLDNGQLDIPSSLMQSI